MLEDYKLLLFEEYKRATGYDFDFETIYDDFIYWLDQKKISNDILAKLYMEMNNDGSYCMAEFGKGKYDTVVPYVKKYTDGEVIAITPFKEMFTRPGFKVYNGKLDIINNDVYVNYADGKFKNKPNCSYIYNNQIDTIMTQLPILNIKPYIKLRDTNKTILIGKCGKSTDLDLDKSVEQITSLATMFKEGRNDRIADIDYSTDGNYYAVGLRVYTEDYKVMSKARLNARTR